jgi:hypothetical protein
MDLMLDHSCRKELTIAAQDEEERETKKLFNHDHKLAVLLKCTVSSGPHIQGRLMLLVTTNKFTQTFTPL